MDSHAGEAMRGVRRGCKLHSSQVVATFLGLDLAPSRAGSFKFFDIGGKMREATPCYGSSWGTFKGFILVARATLIARGSLVWLCFYKLHAEFDLLSYCMICLQSTEYNAGNAVCVCV